MFGFYLLNIFIIFCLARIKANKKYLLWSRIQDLQEGLNILNEQNSKGVKSQAALRAKIRRYNSLKGIIEKINEKLDVDYVAENLASIAFSLISNNKGVCILYLINKQLNLEVFKTKKEDPSSIIKTKEGDIFDFWVLRHSSPILIEDTRKDFRFDLAKLKEQDTRPILSLISSPLLSEHRFLGTLRLESNQANFFSQEDLRFLATICGLGATALENSELFQRVQQLAIHDALTSLYTKGYFLERLKEETKRASRQKAVFSLLMVDIDFFKNYNDKFGHSAGDIVLKKLSQDITESLKGLSPIIGRFGGEEFCVILPRLDKKKAYACASSLCKSIEKERIILRRQATGITVSVGIANFPLDASSETELIEKADKAMYEAKQKGRNQACCI